MELHCYVPLPMELFKRNQRKFRAISSFSSKFSTLSSSGYVQLCGQSSDYEAIGENVYLNLVGAAQKYVYITTPYLVLDNEMQTA